MIDCARVFLIAGLLALLSPRRRAAEPVTLRNGFDLRCDHHAQVDSRVRLYLSAGEDNYIEVPAQDIVRVESVPDQQPVSPETSCKAGSPAASNAQDSARPTWREMLARAGQAHNLDVDLLASLVKAESGGNAHAVSRCRSARADAADAGNSHRLGVEDSLSRTRMCAAARPTWMRCSPTITTTWLLPWPPTTPAPRRWTVSRHSSLPRDASLCGARDSRVQPPRSGA